MNDPRHYHQIEDAPGTLRVKLNELVLAESDRALVRNRTRIAGDPIG